MDIPVTLRSIFGYTNRNISYHLPDVISHLPGVVRGLGIDVSTLPPTPFPLSTRIHSVPSPVYIVLFSSIQNPPQI